MRKNHLFNKVLSNLLFTRRHIEVGFLFTFEKLRNRFKNPPNYNFSVWIGYDPIEYKWIELLNNPPSIHRLVNHEKLSGNIINAENSDFGLNFSF